MGFLFIGMRAKRKIWTLIAAAYLAAGIGLMFLVSAFPTGTKEAPVAENAWVGWVLMAFWAVGVVHSALTNKAWLRARAHMGPGNKSPKPQVPPVAADRAEAAEERGATPRIVDVNSADTSALTRAGLTAEEADSILVARASGGEYAQVTDLIARAGLAPHRFAIVRSNLSVSTPQPDSTPAPSSGRRLDL